MFGVMPDDRFADRVAYTDPYYVASYMVVVRKEGGPVESALQPIAAEPGIAVRGLLNREVQPYPSLNAILEAVAKGEVPGGYVNASRAQWVAHQHWPGKLRFIPTEASVDRFEICAAVRREETDLKDAISRALHELYQSGKLQESFAKWHVPLEK